MAALDGVEDLVAFLEGVFPDGVEGLLAIPGAAIGTAQPGHDAHCFGEKRSRINTHSNTLNDYGDHNGGATVVFDALYLFCSERFASGEFPQRLHPSLAGGRIDRDATVALPALPSADREPG
jgi:hypothetical protein